MGTGTTQSIPPRAKQESDVVISLLSLTIRERALLKGAVWSEKILFMKSNLGGMQLHYNQDGQPQEFEYTFDAPATGKYALTARVVTVTWKQHLLVAVNRDKEPIDIALPFTVGMWDETKPQTVTLVKGRKNKLRMTFRDPNRGVTIKDFQLTPVR